MTIHGCLQCRWEELREQIGAWLYTATEALTAEGHSADCIETGLNFHVASLGELVTEAVTFSRGLHMEDHS